MIQESMCDFISQLLDLILIYFSVRDTFILIVDASILMYSVSNLWFHVLFSALVIYEFHY